MKILSLIPRIPYPLTDGGAIGTYNILRHLHEAGHDVQILALNTRRHYCDPAVMNTISTSTSAVDINTDFRLHRALMQLFAFVPYKFQRFYSREFEHLLQSELKSQSFDVVFVEHAPMLQYAKVIKKLSSCPLVYRAPNVDYTIYRRMARSTRPGIRRLYSHHLAHEIERYERNFFAYCDGILTVTEDDAARVKDLDYQGLVRSVPAGVDLDTFKPRGDVSTKPNTLFYFGAFDWMPNVDAVHWFMKSVYEEMRQKLPDVELHIGGKVPPPDIMAYGERAGVFLHPDVPSAPAFMQTYDIMIVPLLSGGGMRLKIVEAMAMGRPIVSTAVGAEGIDSRHGENIMIAETSDDFIQCISTLLHDTALKERLAANALQTARNHYSWPVLVQRMVEFFEERIHAGRQSTLQS